MTAKHATVALALTAALALAGQPALAQRGQRGGGHPGGGGGHPGVSRAVPRGGGYGGGMAQARHPRAGTGGYSYRPYYGGHYRPYYYYGGYGHYRPFGHSSLYFGASLYFGWPYYHSGWWPYGWADYYNSGYYAPYYGYRYDSSDAPPPRDDGHPYDSDRTCRALRPDASDGDTGRIRLEVRPDDASVYVDDDFCGSAREARFLRLPSGRHAIELVRPGFEIARREVDVVTGETRDVLVELQRP